MAILSRTAIFKAANGRFIKEGALVATISTLAPLAALSRIPGVPPP